MFKSAEEFTFSVKGENGDIPFVGQLVFKSVIYNNRGTLYEPEELDVFMNMLNSNISLPEVWTLETIAESLFQYIKPVMPNLYAINLQISSEPHRVAEYSMEGMNSVATTEFQEAIG